MYKSSAPMNYLLKFLFLRFICQSILCRLLFNISVNSQSRVDYTQVGQPLSFKQDIN